MTSYCYTAIDAHGVQSKGTLEVADQSEALQRIKEMGLFPVKLLASAPRHTASNSGSKPRKSSEPHPGCFTLFGRHARVKPRRLTLFTRQVATLVEAGMPLIRGLHVLEQQEENPRLKEVIGNLCDSIENGSALAEAMAEHPKVFDRLYLNLVRAGELGGALEIALTRLAEFMEKSQRIRGKVKAAMFYPCTVLIVAAGVLVLLMSFVVPRFQQVFQDLMNGLPLPAFTRFVFAISQGLQHHLPLLGVCGLGLMLLCWIGLHTGAGRLAADQLKLALPILGPVFRKASISRFARTLGTLLGNGVPVLQALKIVGDASGNLVVARLVSRLHEAVKQGDPIASTLKASTVFPVMVAGLVDVGEQTGALPEMLLKVADIYDDEVDNAASALTSLLEPIMILFLAVIVGGLVIAMFLPLIHLYGSGIPGTTDRTGE